MSTKAKEEITDVKIDEKEKVDTKSEKDAKPGDSAKTEKEEAPEKEEESEKDNAGAGATTEEATEKSPELPVIPAASKLFPEPDKELPEPEEVEETVFGTSKDDLIAQLLTKPEKVIEDLEQKILARIDKRTQDQIEHKRAWDEFYDSNPELVDFKDLVNLKAKELRSKWIQEKKDLPWNEASKILAEATKGILKKARGSESSVEEVGGSKAVIVSSSGSPAPRKTGKNDVAQGSSFVEQVQRLQQKSVR